MKFICLFFGHKYFTAQKLTPWSRRVCCKRCHQSFAMNDDCRLIVNWDASFHSLYESQGVKIKYLDEEFK